MNQTRFMSIGVWGPQIIQKIRTIGHPLLEKKRIWRRRRKNTEKITRLLVATTFCHIKLNALNKKYCFLFRYHNWGVNPKLLSRQWQFSEIVKWKGSREQKFNCMHGFNVNLDLKKCHAGHYLQIIFWLIWSYTIKSVFKW